MSPVRVSTKNKLSKFTEAKKLQTDSHSSPTAKAVGKMTTPTKLFTPPADNPSPVDFSKFPEMTVPSSPVPGQRRKFEPRVSIFASQNNLKSTTG
jgi:hypothetical protein